MSAGPDFNQLCVRCSQIVSKAECLFEEGTSEARNDFYPLPQWQKNAKWCHICALSFHQAHQGDVASLQNLWSRGQGRDAVIHVEISATAYPNLLSLLFRTNAFPLLAQLNCSIWQDESPPEIPMPSSSERTWGAGSKQQILNWLEECKQQHTVCNNSGSLLRSQANRQLPKRLLEIGSVGVPSHTSQSPELPPEESSVTLRLCRTDKLSLDTPYVTLSHCWGHHPTVAWGRHPAITLTNEVLDAFYNHVPLLENTSPESRTFKDAVSVVKDLGYRFLWIDALCINQDDPKDKADEIAVMDEIYANADFNISATMSTSGSGGLIYARDPLSVEPFRKDINSRSGQRGEIIVYSNRWRQQVDEGFVNSRAWVFQERILAPRIVHFASDQIFWECPTIKAAQSFPHGIPYEARSAGSPRDHVKNWLEVDVLDELEDWETVQEIWASLIPLYSRTNLSFPQDKLPAISGVARRLRKLSKTSDNEYLAGLWRPDLVNQLLWKTDLIPNQGRAVAYRAPSWSWACLDAVSYLNTRRAKDCVVKLVDVHMQMKTSDTFGEVLNGFIRLSGPLCLVSCIRSLAGDLLLEINGNTYPRQLIQTDWDYIPAGSHTQESVIFSDFSARPVYLMSFYAYPERAENLFGMTGLILEPTGKNPGQFSRLGLFKLWQRYPEAHDILVKAFRSKTLGRDAYLEFDGKDKYCIEII